VVEAGKIVCVFGALRSGTTVFRLMLDSHPQLSCPGESDAFFDYLTIGADGWTLDTDALKGNWLFNRSGLQLVEGPARDQVMSLIAQTGRGRDWTVLMVHRDLDRVLKALPGVRLIHLVRDPRDVACSSVGMGWAGNAYHGLDHWLKTEDSWTEAAQGLAEKGILELRYEDLLANPVAELSRVCAFLDVAFVPEMLTYDTRTTYSKPDPKKMQQWQKRLSPGEIGLLEGRLGDRLQSRGYAASGHPVIVPGPTKRLLLTLDHKIGVWRRRVREFGVVDPVLLSVANRLKVSGLAHNAQKRIEARIIAGLK
jgi:Sulfotransferase family